MITIYAKIVKLEERFEHFNWRRVGGDTFYDTRSIGWWMSLEGSRESLFVGTSKPDLEAGEVIKVSFSKRSDHDLPLPAHS